MNLGWIEDVAPGVQAARTYQRQWLRADVVAGLVLAAILVPQGMAYAELAGLPAVTGLYTTIACLIGYALFGPSRVLVLGPDSSISPLIFAAITPLVVAGDDPGKAIALAGMLALLVGLIEIGLGIGKLGFVADLLSSEVQVGYMNGLAITIIVGQLPKLFGYSTEADTFAGEIRAFVESLDQTVAGALLIGLAVLVTLLVLPRITTRIPAVLVAVIGATAVSALLDLSAGGVATVGALPSGFPTPALPWTSLQDVGPLAIAAVGITLVSLTDTIATASSFAARRGEEVEPNQEMIGMGAANATAGLVQGFAVSGSASRTAAVEGAGGSSQMVSLIAAVLVLVTAAFLTPLFTDLPEPVLGAIVVVAVRGFLRTEPLVRYWRLDRRSFWTATTALLGTLVFDLLPGLLIAVALSLVWFIGAASRVRLAVLGRLPDTGRYGDLIDHPDATTVPGLLLVRPDGPLFFANANPLRLGVLQLVRTAAPPPRVVVLDLSSSFRLSLPTLDILAELHDELQQRGIALWLARIRSSAMAELQASGLFDRLSPTQLHATVEDAVRAHTNSDRQSPSQ